MLEDSNVSVIHFNLILSTRWFGLLSSSRIPHPDHKSVDNNSIYYNNKPHSCQGHPLASDREKSCAGSRNPDKLSWAHEDFSLASTLHSHKSYLTVKENLTRNWEAVINSSATEIPTQIQVSQSSYKSEGFGQAKEKKSTQPVWFIHSQYRVRLTAMTKKRVYCRNLPEFKSPKQFILGWGLTSTNKTYYLETLPVK